MEKVLTRNIDPGKAPTDMAAYEANGGYQTTTPPGGAHCDWQKDIAIAGLRPNLCH